MSALIALICVELALIILKLANHFTFLAALVAAALAIVVAAVLARFA